MSIEQNFGNDDTDTIHVGEDKTLRFTIYQSDGTTVQNITGMAVEFVIREHDESPVALLTKTTGGGTIVLTTPTSGILDVTLLDTDTETWKPKVYRYALRRTDAGSETVWAYGDIPFAPASAGTA